jgi:hypothetical protein
VDVNGPSGGTNQKSIEFTIFHIQVAADGRRVPQVYKNKGTVKMSSKHLKRAPLPKTIRGDGA